MGTMNLLPCPFCGGTASLDVATGDSSVRNGNPFYWIEHVDDNCPIRPDHWSEKGGMATRYFDTAEEAAASWNRRVV